MSARNQFETKQWFTARIFVGGASGNAGALQQFMYESTSETRAEAIGNVLTNLRAHQEHIKGRALGIEEAIRELEAGLANG